MRTFWNKLNGFKSLLKKNKTQNWDNWKHQLLSLYIVRNSDGICLFSHHFKLGLISQIETQLVGMAFTALSKLMREVVDSNSNLNLIDLGKKKVLIDEKKKFSSFLITTEDTFLIRRKLTRLTDYFEKIFELQYQINERKLVCSEDYALTSDLVSLIFEEQPSKQILGLIPLIFDSIKKSPSIYNNKKDKSLLKSLD